MGIKKILVVDNHDVILDVMETLLTSAGYLPMTSSSYERIDEIIKDDRPDMIILDVMLDNQDGRAICKALKSNPETKDICIILFSASEFHLKNFEKYDADGVLSKPFEIADLERVISLCKN